MALRMAGSLSSGAVVLRGRGDECAQLDGLREGALEGRGGVLMVRGEAGVGKTALLEYAIESAPTLRVIRVAGIESEMELAFAGLHQLCAPMLDRLDRVPGPQRDALETTFGLSAGAVPDRFLVGLAVLSLLSEVAEERPLLCVIDDAQWLDRASADALAFVARRLLAEPVVLLFAAREPSDSLTGLPKLQLEGLGDADARALLASVVPGRLDKLIAEQVIAETRGNPLALLELPRGLSAAELAGGFGLPGAQSLSGRIEKSFLRRLDALPDEHPPAVAHGSSGANWRSCPSLAGGPPARDRRAGTRAGGVGRADRCRCQGAVSPSAGALGALPGGSAAGKAAGTWGVGPGNRRADRSRSACLAPRRGDRWP